MAAPINPKGAKSDKIWRAAIMRAVSRLADEPVAKRVKSEQRLERLADALVSKGLESDVSALKEIGDRLDGRPAQVISGDPENTTPISIIERVIVGHAQN